MSMVYWLIDTLSDRVVGSTHDLEVADEMAALYKVSTEHHCKVFPVDMPIPAKVFGARHRSRVSLDDAALMAAWKEGN